MISESLLQVHLVTDRIIAVIKRSDWVEWGNLLGHSHNAKLDKGRSPDILILRMFPMPKWFIKGHRCQGSEGKKQPSLSG